MPRKLPPLVVVILLFLTYPIRHPKSFALWVAVILLPLFFLLVGPMLAIEEEGGHAGSYLAGFFMGGGALA